MSRLALAIDPGLCTGWASTVPVWEETHEVRTEEVCEPMQLVANAADWIEEHRAGYDLVVVCEEFRITTETGKKTQAPWSLELTGALRYLCWRSDVPFYQQTPGDAKRFCDNDRLRGLGFWHRGGEGHANDAARHLALFLAKLRDPWMLAMLGDGA